MTLFDSDALGPKPSAPIVTPVGQVDPKLKAAALNDINTATTLGWEDRQDQFLYPAGTRPMDGALDHSRAEFNARPLFTPALSNFIGRIGAEGRKDISVNVPDMMMLPDGRIQHRANTTRPPMEIERKGLEGLLRHIPGASSGVGYLTEQIPASLRAPLFNYHAERDYREKETVDRYRGTRTERKPHAVKLRLRNGNGKYKLWAVVGKNFPTVDVDDIAEALIEADLPGGARGEIKYDGYKASLTALWHYAGSNIGVGQFIRAGIRCSTADDGTGAFNIAAVLEQARCINLSVVPQEKATRFAHRGEEVGLTVKIKNAIALAQNSIAPFVKRWSEIERDQVMDGGDTEKCFTLLVERGFLKIPGVERTDLVGRLVKAWEFDRGMSRAHVINAVTRAAHTNTWASPWAQEAMEEQAGQLVYVKQLQLSE